MSINQISLFLENRTGQLADITQLLSENGINLRAISIAETADYGILRLLADDSEKTVNVLKNAGNIINVSEVTVIAVPDKPAGLSELLMILANEGVAVEYMYSLFVRGSDEAYMVMRVTDYDKLISAVNKHGLKKISSQELGLK